MNHHIDQGLIEAVQAGDEGAVGHALADGADPDVTVARFRGSVLVEAARSGRLPIVQFMLGEHRVGLDDVPIVRTAVRVAPTEVQLAGDPQMLHQLAGVIDIALNDLGDDEWQTRTGTDADAARAVATRLREELIAAANASWHQLVVTADELAIARSALVELAYGTTRVMPIGASRLQIVDLLEELNRQVGR